jgi:DNA-binding NarL/FixJ family response regulator
MSGRVLLRHFAEVAVKTCGMPPEAADTVESVLRAELSRLYGGEKVWLSTARMPQETREARNQRILAALAAGEATATIARREGVSVRMVRWLRGKAGR